MKAYIESYGCTLNFGEAREMEELLAERGWRITEDPSDADMVFLATCAVIETTERAMLRRIKELSQARALVVTGCMATACKEKVLALAPGARLVPPGDMDSLSRIIGPSVAAAERPKEREGYGIVPIASGCVGTCAYCITRLARGPLRSRAPEKIAEAVRRLASAGPREIQLTAQDTAAYGQDIGTSLPELVSKLCLLPGEFRLRIGMMNPRSALSLAEALARMYRERKVFKFLHLPVQSASDRLLAEMERGYTLDEFEGLVSRIRSSVPDMTLSTDLIVGYPGESEEDHQANMRLIRRVRPDIVNVTRFSPRPGTKAARAGPPVVGWKAKERSRELTRLRFEVSLARNQEFVGKTVVALATESGKGRSTVLRTDGYKQVVVREELPLGRFYELRIEEATPTYLVGTRVDA